MRTLEYVDLFFILILKKWLRDIIVNFAIAGRDTTAMLSTWAVSCLIKNPDTAEKVRAEIGSVLGDRPPTPDDLSQLKYLGNVLRETLRLYPSVPSTG